MRLVHFLTILAAMLCVPSIAHAWGPGMHLEIALTLLTKAAIAAPAVRALMKAFPSDFLYGAVSPDIFLRKKLAGLYHCHNWRMGALLLSEAATDRQRAAAYGYLAHLAADVIAHNYFIPYKIVRSYRARLLSHAYWELRYDLTVPAWAWEAVPRIVSGNYREFDELLERVMKKTLFSFRTSKRIYYSLLVVQRLRRLQQGLKLYAKASRWDLVDDRVQSYRRLVFRTVEDFLQKLDAAACCRGDPTGIARETEALDMRRRIRRAVLRRILTREQADRFVRHCGERLEAGVFHTAFSWPDLF
ncbi:MAG: zinc dependent phospholipase C family protein [Deltaproteobacteria bacterium]|nr:zinc dependent phospholipase C family protein [Deltaproteobacteria bacterium]